MTTRKYKPYPTRKQQKSRRMRTIGMVLIGSIVALVIFNRTYTKPRVEEQGDPSVVSSKNPVPESSKPKVGSEPISILNPAVASAESAPKPAVVTPSIQETPSVPEPAPLPEPVMVEPATADPQGAQSSPQAKASVDEAIKLRDAGKIIEARELLNDVLKEKLSPNLRSAVKLQLSKLAETWLFSREPLANDKLTGTYQVQRGDHLAGIAKEYKVPYEILMQINGINRPELLQAGQRIKVIHYF